MKKLDFLIVLGLLFIGFIIFLLFNDTSNSNTIQIIINNEVIEELDIYNNTEYRIQSDEYNIYIYKNKVLIKKIDNEAKKDIYNVITIENSKVIMSESNCKGKDCMHMEITLDKKLPIICTNGVVIKISNNDNKSDITISCYILN